MDNLRAIGLTIASMAAFAMGDALVSLALGHVSVPEVLLGASLVGLAIFGTLVRRAGDPLVTKALGHPVILFRNGIEAVTAITMVSALALAPVSLVVAILQAAPLMVTVGAALVLKERVGPRRWIAVAVGFCGVLVMLRPDASGGLAGPLLALVASAGLAARDLATRLAPADVTTPQMAVWGMAALIPAAAVLWPFATPTPSATGYGLVFAAALATAAGYFAITAAMRMGEVSLVIPFRYTRLLFALFIAVVFLGERPDVWTLIGAAIVIGSGLFVLWRERAAAQGGA